MSTLDARKNFAISTVTLGYDASATSIVLTTGDGAKFPQPSTDGAFNLVWWNSAVYPSPADDPNKEIVRCTARTSDTLTIVRAQEGTSATTKNTAGGTYKVQNGPTKKTIDDIETVLDSTEKTANKGAANGYAPLGSDSLVPSAYLPDITITDTFVVGSQAAMLALTCQKGDVAVRTDLNKTFILKGTDPTVLANWQELLTPTDTVLSVNGQTGAVTLTTSNIAEGSNLYFTAARALAAFTISTGLTLATATLTANLSTGVVGGQSVVGGTASGNNLTLSSTSHATKGNIVFGTSAYDEVNNRLGIGTASPSYILDVKGSNNQIRFDNFTNARGLLLANGSGTQIGGIGRNDTLGSGTLNINALGTLSFKANYSSGGYSGGGDMVITTSGNVGIGTTSPNSILALGGTAARTIQMERNTTAATAGQGLTLSSGGAIAGTANLVGGDLTLKSGISTGTGTSNLRFFTATAGTTGTTDNTPTEKMTILGSGYVGIGTTAPQGKLHVAGTSDWQGTIRVDSNGTSYASYGWYKNGTKKWSAYSNDIADVDTLNFADADGTIALSIQQDSDVIINIGNVGIGTTSPTFPLQITTTASDLIRLERSGYRVWDITLANSDFNIRDFTAGSIVPFTIKAGAPANSFLISATGTVGFGTSSPTAVLHLKAGNATAGTAPIKLTSGVNLTTAETGAIEYNGTNLFFTRSGTVRENVLVAIDNVAAPTTSIGVGIVNFYGSAATNFLGDPNRWLSVNVLGSTYKIPLYT